MQTINEKINKDLILREKLALQRTTMANQSTFLSFLRTSMYFLVAGLGMKNLIRVDNSLIFQVLFYIIALIILLAGILNYLHQKRKIKESEIHIGNYKMEYIQ